MSKFDKIPSTDKIPAFSITSLFGSFGKPSKEVNPYLDKAREAIAKLKEQGKLPLTAASVYKSIRIAFIVDLDEVNITGEKRKKALEALDKAWEEHQEGRQNKEIMNCDEIKELDALLLKKVEKLKPLEDAISNYKPQDQPLGAFLTQLTEQFPSLKPYLSFLGPLLTMFGLGSLKEEVAATSEAKDKKPDAKKKPKPKKGIEKKDEAPKETLASLPKTWAPRGKTLVMGDSNLAENKQLIFEKGRDDLVAKGSMHASWAVEKIEQMSDDRINGYHNLVLGFGGNDLGAKEPYEILESYKKIVRLVREANKKRGDNFKTKIFIVTTPPVGDGTKVKLNGNWGKKPQIENHKATNDKRNKLNQMIRVALAKKEFDFDEVIDMAATVANGGVSNDELTAMAEGMDHHGDPVHVNQSEYAKRIRFGMYLSEKKDEEENNKIA